MSVFRAIVCNKIAALYLDGNIGIHLAQPGKDTCGCRGGCACVQIAGCIELACSGTAPTPGYVKLTADANGGVCSGEGRERLVLDCSDGIVTIML